eukprot:SAG25_NODE_1757_length_2390_cov_2.061982_2_plen_133_part_00
MHARLGAEARCSHDTDVIQQIGKFVAANSLVTRAEAARQLATAQRARMLRGECILLGTVVRILYGPLWGPLRGKHREGVYIGDAASRGRLLGGSYSFRFGEGVDAKVEQVYPRRMRPEEWSVQLGIAVVASS